MYLCTCVKRSGFLQLLRGNVSRGPMNLNSRLSAALVFGALALGGFVTFRGTARAQTAGPNDSIHFAYDTSAGFRME